MLSPAPACADTVIYRSPENGYGWSASSSVDRAHQQARRNCEALGATCEAVIQCHEGWAAVARADAVGGFCAACGMRNPFFARAVALAKCMEASNAICWTDAAFDKKTTLAADNNRQFDLVFLAQVMLQIIGYDLGGADGEFGAKTRAALEAFEADIGRSPAGKLDNELFQRLLNAVAGDQRLAANLKRAMLDPHEATIRRLAYGHATSPAPRANYSQALAAQPVEERLTSLATLLSARSSRRCTVPALSGELVGDASGGTWLVGCVEGTYQLIVPENGSITTILRSTAPSTKSQQNNQPPSAWDYRAEFAARPAGERLMALATLIAAHSKKCTPPALSAEPFGAELTGVWNVRCAEGSYQVVRVDKGSTVVTNWTPLEEAATKPAVEPEPQFNPDPMAALAEPDPTRQAVEQMRTLTKGYEYYGQNYPRESVKDVAFEPSQKMLVVVVEDAEEGDPLFAIIPLRIVKVVPDEFDIGEPAIFFRCDPACITTAYGEASEAIEKLSTGRVNELWKPVQTGEFAFGCDFDRCTALENALEQMVEFARRP